MVLAQSATEPLGVIPMGKTAVFSKSQGLTSSSRATVIKMAQPHMPARPSRWSVRRPARSTKSTCGESGGRECSSQLATKSNPRAPRAMKPAVWPFHRQAVTETKVKTVLTTPAPMVA